MKIIGFIITVAFLVYAFFFACNCAYFAAERRWDKLSILYRCIPILNIYSFFKFKMYD